MNSTRRVLGHSFLHSFVHSPAHSLNSKLLGTRLVICMNWMLRFHTHCEMVLVIRARRRKGKCIGWPGFLAQNGAEWRRGAELREEVRSGMEWRGVARSGADRRSVFGCDAGIGLTSVWWFLTSDKNPVAVLALLRPISIFKGKIYIMWTRSMKNGYGSSSSWFAHQKPITRKQRFLAAKDDMR